LHRIAGDAARDKRDWKGAEAAYREHLRNVPDDFDIWVQIGHSFKEQDKLAEAENAYRQAISIKSDDGDAHLQLGHLLKRSGRLPEAAEAYESSFNYNPTQDAFSELDAFRRNSFGIAASSVTALISPARDAVLIEIDDLLGYLEAHKTLSGIQRVQVGVIQHVLSSSEQDQDTEYHFVLNPMDAEYLWCIRNTDLSELVSYVTGSSVDHIHLKQIVARCRGRATARVAASGQIYLILGAFWGYGGVAARYFNLKKSGLRVGVYIYDLIPITHTEYCDEGLPHEFALSLADGMMVFDFVLTISEFTAQEVRRYLQKHKLPAIPVKAVPLAHADRLVHDPAASVWGPQIAHLRGRPFALMVSTIEARKNHGYLVAAWKQFIDEGLDPPDLVFVGRFGWRVSSLMEMLKTLRYLDNKIQIVHDLSDRDLNTLYAACQFTLFPSFVEGWGLPVGESLAHGKPCVASSTSSIPEVGGKLVDYLDPQDYRAGVDVIRKMAFNTAYRDGRAQDIRTGFKLRSWRDVGADLLRQVALLRQDLPKQRAPEVMFSQGGVFRPGQLALGRKLPSDYPSCPLRLMLVSSWYGVENFGCWMKGSRALLRFKSDLPAGTSIVVYLQLCGPRWAAEEHMVSATIGTSLPQKIEAWTESNSSPKSVRADSVFVIHATGLVEHDGIVTVAITVAGTITRENNEPHGRQFVVGLKAIGYAARSDAAARLDIADSFMFG